MTASLRGLATRQRILRSAVLRFADQGYRQTSVAQVARDTGLTPPAVHAHFGSKEALFQAAFDEDVANLLAVMRHRLAHGWIAGGPGNPTATLIPELLAAMEDHPLVRRVFRGLEPDRTRELLDTPAVHATRDQLVATVRSGQSAGFVRADIDAVHLAGAIETIVLALLLAAVQGGIVADEPRRAAVQSVVLQGLMAQR
jgi:AcrR family transcriptional regulator